MSIKAFLVDALTSALDLGIGAPDDIVRHVTPDVLATHLPRPLWARLLTACLGASRVDAQLVVETVGVPNLCEHVPHSILWLAIRDIAARALGKPDATAVTSSPRASVLAPPPDTRPAPPAAPPPPAAVGPAIPAPASLQTETLSDLINELETDAPTSASEARAGGLRARTPTSQRFRPSNTAAARLGAARRPQAVAPTPASAPTPMLSSIAGRPRREPTEVEDQDIETKVGDGSNEWAGGSGRAISVDDSQLVDWQANTNDAATALSDEDFSDIGPKR